MYSFTTKLSKMLEETTAILLNFNMERGYTDKSDLYAPKFSQYID